MAEQKQILNSIANPYCNDSLPFHPSTSPTEGIAKMSPHRLRSFKYWKLRKNISHQILASIITDSNDGRPRVDVQLGEYKYCGLLDSGANLSVLGKGCEVFLSNPAYKVTNLLSMVRTASGQKKRVLGYLTILTTFNKHSKPFKFHLCPDLTEKLYLGIDFWHEFGIAPIITAPLKPVPISSVSLSSVTVSPTELDSNMHNLTAAEKSLLDEIVNNFPSSEALGLGKTTLTKHEIQLVENAVPVKQRYYPVSPAKQADLDSEIDRMLRLGVIEECRGSEWSSPVTLVRKANGKIRLCLDARKVNEATVKDAYPLPIIEGLLGRLDQTRYISSIDLKDAFWQIPLGEGSRDKTAFTVPGRPLYQFAVMPFGLCNAPQRMCRLMDRVIPHHLHDRIFVYLDDLLITSATYEEHLVLLREVSRLLKEAGLTINVTKSKFVLKSTRYLGYVIGNGTIRVDSEKVRCIKEYPVPKNIRQIRRFLGMTGYYRRFISNYSSIAVPLTNMLSKNKAFRWTSEAQLALDKLKQALISAPVLQNADFKKQFFIQCDASSVGIGSVLFQVSDDGSEHPIAYASKKLNSAQRNYSITELECYAVVHGIKSFRAYVEGYNFVVITDHASLKWLMAQRDLTGRLARWALKLQPYTFRIVHRSGAQNIVPDTLSRMNMEELLISGDIPDKHTNTSCDDHSALHINLSSPAFSSPEYLAQIHKLQQHPNIITNTRVEDGKIFILLNTGISYDDSIPNQWKLLVPCSITPELLARAHESPTAAHLGIAKTLERLQRQFYWIGMIKQVKEYVNNCSICKTCKPVNYVTRPPIGDYHEEIFRPFQFLYIDYLGPYPRSKLGNGYILIILDKLSRFVWLYPLKQATTKGTIIILEKLFLRFSVPQKVFTDNGTQFTAVGFKHFMDKFGINHTYTPKYSPQSNASERVNRTLLSAVRCFIKHDQRYWDQYLSEFESALNNAVHSGTKYSPHFVLFGQNQILNGKEYDLYKLLGYSEDGYFSVTNKANKLSNTRQKALEHLKISHANSAKYYNLRTRPRNFRQGEYVYVRNFAQSDASKHFSAKLAPKFIKGVIHKNVGNVAYEVHDEKGKNLGTYHTKDIQHA